MYYQFSWLRSSFSESSTASSSSEYSIEYMEKRLLETQHELNTSDEESESDVEWMTVLVQWFHKVTWPLIRAKIIRNCWTKRRSRTRRWAPVQGTLPVVLNILSMYYMGFISLSQLCLSFRISSGLRCISWILSPRIIFGYSYLLMFHVLYSIDVGFLCFVFVEFQVRSLTERVSAWPSMAEHQLWPHRSNWNKSNI